MLGEDRIMDSLKRFFLPKKILKFKKRLGEDRIMDALICFFQIKNMFLFKDYGFI